MPILTSDQRKETYALIGSWSDADLIRQTFLAQNIVSDIQNNDSVCLVLIREFLNILLDEVFFRFSSGCSENK